MGVFLLFFLNIVHRPFERIMGKRDDDQHTVFRCQSVACQDSRKMFVYFVFKFNDRMCLSGAEKYTVW